MFPLHFPYRASPCAIRFQLSCNKILVSLIILHICAIYTQLTSTWNIFSCIKKRLVVQRIRTLHKTQSLLIHNIFIKPFRYREYVKTDKREQLILYDCFCSNRYFIWDRWMQVRMGYPHRKLAGIHNHAELILNMISTHLTVFVV